MRKIAAAFLWLLALAADTAVGQVPIVNTKHNLSAGSANTIKSAPTGSGGTTEICVFCHTPHGASTVAQLWNREPRNTSYQLYGSDYLTSLGYTGPAQPKTRSRLCMSCHDGTVALGSVYNLPGSGGYSAPPGAGIPMVQSGVAIPDGRMPASATGWLNTVLTDDHPVGYLYEDLKDPELIGRGVRPWPWNTAVKLDPDASTGTVECQSCHEPHNNQFGKFLRMDNTNAALCTHCHNKTGYGNSAHQAGGATTAFYRPAGAAANTTVAEYSCRSCHKPHSSGGTPYILRGAEENTCYERGCHGTNTNFTDPATPATPAERLIQPELNKTRRHPVNTFSGRHKNKSGGESDVDLGGVGAVNRHAECQDCHNPHQAQPVVPLATRGGLMISAALKGAWGVQPNWPTPETTTLTTNKVKFAAIASYSKVAAPTEEYQICLKCHSNYTTLPAGARNIAEEINPQNSSYHGIVSTGTRNLAIDANAATLLNEPWAGGRRVWCSDCHGSEAGAGARPQGPHGSTLTGIAPGTSNSDKMLVATIASSNAGTPLCLVCHKSTSYQNGNTGSAFTRHGTASVGNAEGCFACHMWENPTVVSGGTGDIFPHGMNKRWVTIGLSGTGSQQMVQAFNGGWMTNVDYLTKQCWAVDSAGKKISGSPCGGHTGSGGTY